MSVNNFLPTLHYSGSQKGFQLEYGRALSGSARCRPVSTYEEKILRSALLGAKDGNQKTGSLEGVRVFSNKFLQGASIESATSKFESPLVAKPVPFANKSKTNTQKETMKTTALGCSTRHKIMRRKSAKPILRTSLNVHNTINSTQNGAIPVMSIKTANTPKQTSHEISRSTAQQKSTNVNAKTVKVYLSQKQSPSISTSTNGSVRPAAPPGTPSVDMMKKVNYIPSMSDNLAKQQIKSKLKTMKRAEEEKSRARKADQMKVDAKEQKDRELELKKQQRRMIYLLNTEMTKNENNQFEKFKTLNTLKLKEYPSPNLKRNH